MGVEPIASVTDRALQVLNAVMRSLLAERDYDRMLDQVIGTVLEELHADRGYLVAGSPGGLEVRAIRNFTIDRISGERGIFSRSIVRDVMLTEQPVLLYDAAESAYAGQQSVLDLSLASVLAVPIAAPGGPLGVVYLESSAAGRFSAEDRDILLDVLAVSGRMLAEVVARSDAEARAASLACALAHAEEAPFATADPAMEELLAVVGQVAPSTAPVLIQGESGCGKELIARALHRHSRRSAKPLVAVHCGALSEPLLESELFGHVRGAFTGALRDRPGLLEAADGGTLFLDEIGEMPLALQVKLLRALQHGEYKPVGSDSTRVSDVRVISATHRDLEAAVQAGTFRRDLFFRLNAITLEVPPLRRRSDDILLLFHLFSRRLARRYRIEPPTATAALLEHLVRYPWPGNVRELENEVDRLFALSLGRSRQLGPELLSSRIRAAVPRTPDPRSLTARLEDEQRDAIHEMLERQGGNRTRAAKALGISRETLRVRMKRLGL
jgi:transcriptional regulator with GAF, ATPase, and Fis domain